MSSFPNDFDQIRNELLSTLNIREDYSMEILSENTGRLVDLNNDLHLYCFLYVFIL